jgi:hypothetical protein
MVAASQLMSAVWAERPRLYSLFPWLKEQSGTRCSGEPKRLVRVWFWQAPDEPPRCRGWHCQAPPRPAERHRRRLPETRRRNENVGIRRFGDSALECKGRDARVAVSKSVTSARIDREHQGTLDELCARISKREAARGGEATEDRLQRIRYFVLRFLAEDVGKQLDRARSTPY